MRLTVFSIPAIFISLIFLYGCEDKTEVTESSGTVAIDLEYMVGNDELQMDQLIYTNAAGNDYSVATMRYLLSDFRFHQADGSEVTSDEVFYASADRDDLTTLLFEDFPFGDYTGVSFVIGLQPEMNTPDGLPNIEEFNNMTWPVGMGGGYHFMQFEGHYIDSSGQVGGFAWHLGRDVSLMPFDLDHSFTLTASDTKIGTLTMDIENYFIDPLTIDLDTTQFSMMNLPHMEMLATNSLDVFSLN